MNKSDLKWVVIITVAVFVLLMVSMIVGFDVVDLIMRFFVMR